MRLEYGEFMKRLMKAKGWKHEDLAARMGGIQKTQVDDFLEACHEPRAGLELAAAWARFYRARIPR